MRQEEIFLQRLFGLLDSGMQNDFAPMHKILPSFVPGKKGNPQELMKEFVLPNPLIQVRELTLTFGIKVSDTLLQKR